MLTAQSILVARRNLVLSTLDNDQIDRILRSADLFELESGQFVHAPGERIDYVHFPISCLVSHVHTMENGGSVELGQVGREGIVEIAWFFGKAPPAHGAVVQVGGLAVRLKAEAVAREFELDARLRDRLMVYADFFLTQTCQLAACNRLHSVEHRLCRWLLMGTDRLTTADLSITQEFLSNLLGDGRQSVTVAAGRLKRNGWIRYARGHISVVNRRGLEGAACECYGLVHDAWNRLVCTDPGPGRAEGRANPPNRAWTLDRDRPGAGRGAPPAGNGGAAHAISIAEIHPDLDRPDRRPLGKIQ